MQDSPSTIVDTVAGPAKRTFDLDRGSFEKLSVLRGEKLVRSRALAVLGTALVGVATRMVLPDSAEAIHSSVNPPCFGYGGCHCCNGSTCCTSVCEASYSHTHCPGGGQCWYSCYCGTTWNCCDWHVKNTNQQTHCICYGVVTTCGAGC